MATDSDLDTISDAEEGAGETVPRDSDGDGTPDYLDADSDNDSIADSVEAGDADLATPALDTDGDGAPDYVDVDSDGDYLPDEAEDSNGNGMLDSGETNARSADTDQDGYSDLVEELLGYAPTNPDKNPRGDGVVAFVVPYQQPPQPATQDVTGVTVRFDDLDVYLLQDAGGTMSAENTALKDELASIANGLTCAPAGAGAAASCARSIWWGLGSVGYAEGVDSFLHIRDLQPDVAGVAAAIDPMFTPDGCCDEAYNFALWATVTGQGTAASGCPLGQLQPDRSSCAGSPAGMNGLGGRGYPCFRDGAAAVTVMGADEAPTQTEDCPVLADVGVAAAGASVRVAGLLGSGAPAQVRTDLEQLATASGALDSSGDPLVLDASNAAAGGALELALRRLLSVPFDLEMDANDDTSDAVDATGFIEHLATLQLGTAACADGLTESDTNGDLVADSYLSVPRTDSVCWRVTAAANTSVMHTSTAQVFRVELDAHGGQGSEHVLRSAYFIVPPEL